MIRRTRTLALTLALTCAAFAAQATPPDAVTLTDQLFGISAEKVFLLRRGSDNMGLYSTDRRGVALVIIDRATGAEETLPVYRSLRVPDTDNHPDSAQTRITPDALPATVDPFAILRAQNAEAILTPTEADASHQAASAPADLAQRAQQALDGYAATIGDYQRMGSTLSLQHLIAGAFTPDGCRADHSLTLQDTSAAQPAQLIHTLCGTPEDGITAAIYLLLAPTKTPPL